MSGGFRSGLAFWIGGASAPLPITDAGYRSLLAFWIGGASSKEEGGNITSGWYDEYYEHWKRLRHNAAVHLGQKGGLTYGRRFR